MATEYRSFSVIVKVPVQSEYDRAVQGQVYDVFLKRETRVFLYRSIKPSRLAGLLDSLIFNVHEEVESVP